jgi:hypothetical protein
MNPVKLLISFAITGMLATMAGCATTAPQAVSAHPTVAFAVPAKHAATATRESDPPARFEADPTVVPTVVMWSGARQ